MAIWKSFRIYEVMGEIGNNQYVLPVIQRRLVWDEDKMTLLFDTLLKGDSFGGIMVIEEEKNEKPLFSFRPFTKDGEPIASRQIETLTQNQLFVIDGQQRLQTFYIGLKGTINGKILYFDLYSDFRFSFEFKFENDMSKLPARSKENIDRPIPEHFWYSVNDLFRKLKETNDEDQVTEEILKVIPAPDDIIKTHIAKNIKAFYKNIFTAETLGVSKVLINRTLNESENRLKIVELFRRLNDGGTKLSPFDLVASILKGFEWKMESFLDEVLDKYKDIGLNQDNLIKMIFLLQDNSKKEMTDITEDDAQFAIEKKERIISVLACLKKFLVYSSLDNYYKEGNRSFIPLFFIAYHIFHKNIPDSDVETYFDNYDANNPEFVKIKKWIYYSLINGVFRSKGAGWIPYKTGIKKILEKLKDFKNAEFPQNLMFKIYYDHGITFTETIDETKLDILESQFIFYLIYDKKQIVRIQDTDHIMPKSILIDLKFEWSKINSIRNFQLLDFGTNRGEKNGKAFKKWIEHSVTDIPGYISKHLIPQDQKLWTEDKFEEFSAERARLILDKIVKELG